MVSRVEKDFVLQGASFNNRIDGRSAYQRRSFAVKPAFLPRTIGSCRVTQENGNDVIVALRLETGCDDIDLDEFEFDSYDIVPSSHRSITREPKRFEFSIDCPPQAYGTFEPKEVGRLCLECTSLVNSVLNSPSSILDLSKLSAMFNTNSWKICISATVLKLSGNLIDTLFLAINSSLKVGFFPVVPTDENVEEVKKSNFELLRLEDANKFPISITFGILGKHGVVDTSPIEELCAAANVTFIISPNGNVCGVLKRGNGPISPAMMDYMFSKCIPQGLDLLQEIDRKLAGEFFGEEESQSPILV